MFSIFNKVVSHNTVSNRNYTIYCMSRKKWTAKATLTDAESKASQKKKWQLALRRYVVENQISEMYAPYFGIDSMGFRTWIALQFVDGLSWDNYGSLWQFDHIVPLAYFNLTDDDDLKLCWHFINIGITKLDDVVGSKPKIDVITIKPYFENMLSQTNFTVCAKMVEKINMLIDNINTSNKALDRFITEKKDELEALQTLTAKEYVRINKGETLKDILMEQIILKKYG